jgi:hypothetical protein
MHLQIGLVTSLPHIWLDGQSVSRTHVPLGLASDMLYVPGTLFPPSTPSTVQTSGAPVRTLGPLLAVVLVVLVELTARSRLPTPALALALTVTV